MKVNAKKWIKVRKFLKIYHIDYPYLLLLVPKDEVKKEKLYKILKNLKKNLLKNDIDEEEIEDHFSPEEWEFLKKYKPKPKKEKYDD